MKIRLRAELARFIDANPAIGANQIAQNLSTGNAPSAPPEGQAAAGSFNVTRAQNQLTQNNSNYSEQLAARNAYRGAGGGGAGGGGTGGPDAGQGAQPSLCGGQTCNSHQFCCGPPPFGHCAIFLTGPPCPPTFGP